MRTVWWPCPRPATVTCESPRGTHVSGTSSMALVPGPASVWISRQAWMISSMLGAVELMENAMSASALASGAGNATSIDSSRSTSVGRT